MHTLAETQVRIGLSSDVELVGTVEHAASRLAEPSQICTFCPASIDAPPNVTSRVAVRRFDGDGDVHRTISSTAVGNSVEIRTQRSQLLGMFGQRQQPTGDRVAGRLRARAEQQTEKQIELEVRHGRRVRIVEVALATTDNMSSVGSARFDAINSWP